MEEVIKVYVTWWCRHKCKKERANHDSKATHIVLILNIIDLKLFLTGTFKPNFSVKKFSPPAKGNLFLYFHSYNAMAFWNLSLSFEIWFIDYQGSVCVLILLQQWKIDEQKWLTHCKKETKSKTARIRNESYCSLDISNFSFQIKRLNRLRK